MIIGFPPQRNPQNPPKKYCEKINYVKMLSKKEIPPKIVEIQGFVWRRTWDSNMLAGVCSLLFTRAEVAFTAILEYVF